MTEKKFIPINTKCTWYDNATGKQLTGWVVIVPARTDGYYTLSTKYKNQSLSKVEDKAFLKKVHATKLNVIS